MLLWAGLAVSCWVLRPTANAQTHTVLKHFAAYPSAYNPQAGLTLSGGVLYGTTSSGGSAGGGAVFKLNADGSGYTEIKSFAGSAGSSLEGGVALSSGVLYGTARLGGSYSKGTVFKVNTDGTGFAVLNHFYFGVGSWPRGGPVLSGSVLYGTTTDEDGSGVGSVFKLNTDGSGYARIKSFSSSDGKFPYAGLTLSGGVLYGTATAGGINGPGYGTVFKMNPDGSGFAVLKHFSSTDGRTPQAVLVAAGGVLYGTTKDGGSSDLGTVFKVNTDGTGFSVLKHFPGGTDGKNPYAGLALSGSVLYGTTYFGGSSDTGTCFKLNTDGSGYSVLKHFGGSDGSYPQGELAISGGVLFGTTYRGGSSNAGTVFSLSLGTAPTITAQPTSRTVVAGSTATFSVTATGDAPLSYQWRKNGTDIAGATSASYTISAVAASDAGDYSVIVTNSFGSGTSSVATLTVSSAPANDNFASRITIPSAGGTVTGSNVGATKETGEPNHYSAGGASVWWSWTAPVSQQAIVDTIGSSFDTLLGIYTGTNLSGLTIIGMNDDVGGGRQSRVTFNAAAGTTYQIAVDGYQNAQGSITLNVSLTPAPVITVQPVSQTLPLGGTLALSVTANNAAAYQWRKDGTNLVTGGRITGATTSGIAITGLTVADSGGYTVVVTNAGGSVTSAVATVTVLANNPPVATAQSVTTAEDTAKAITLTGTDADGNPLTYVVVSSPTNGVLTGTGASRTYTPNTNFNGSDSFTFKVNDGTVDSAPATVSITVTAVNDAPVALAQSVTTPAGAPKAITLAGTDVQGSPLTYVVVNNPANGVLTGTGTSRTYTPNANFTGSDSFTFKVNDGTVDSAPATVSITVTAPANDNFASRITIPSAGGTVTGSNVGATKETGEPNHYSAGGASVWWSWTAPVSQQAIVDTIGSSFDTLLGIYTGTNLSGLTIIGMNDDVGGGDNRSRLTFNAVAGTTYQIAVDGYQNAQGSITLNVIQAPPPGITVQPGSQTLPLGGTLALSVTATDAATYQWRKDGTKLVTGGRITGATTSALAITGLTVADSGGYTVVVTNAGGSVTSAVATVRVLANNPPVALAQSVTTPAGTPKAITLAGTDVQGSPLTYTVVVQPANGTLTGSGASRTYTPKAGFTGGDSFMFKVQNGTADSTPATVSITVTPVNLPPVLRPLENRPLPVGGNHDAQRLSVIDPDDNVTNLTFSVVSSITNVTAEVASYDFLGQPFITVRTTATNWSGGRADITVTVRDPAGATDSKTFSVFRGTVGFTLLSLPNPAGNQWTIPPGLDIPLRWQAVACSADGSIRMGVADGGSIYINTNNSTEGLLFGYGRYVGPELAWTDIACSADGTKIVAVGNRTNIFTSWDTGATWVPRAFATNWISVASSANGTKLVAVGDYSIFTSADSGQTWTRRSLGGSSVTRVASSADGNRLVAASRAGAVYTSTDAGRNWVRRGIQGWWTDVASSADGLKLVVVGDGGLKTDENNMVRFEDNSSNGIFTSEDGGMTWTPRARGYMYSVACSADGVELVASGSAGLKLSQDSGLSWKSIAGSPTTGSRSVVASSTNGGVLLMAAYQRDKYVNNYREERLHPNEGRLAESRDGTQPVTLQAYTGVPFVLSNFATITVPSDNVGFQISIERHGGDTLVFSVPPAVSRDGTLTFTLAPSSARGVQTLKATFTAWLDTDYGSPPSQDFIISSTTAMMPRGLSLYGGATIGNTGGDLGVSFTGTPPVSYQWLRNGTPVPGATSGSLPIAGLARDTSRYSVIVSNAYGASTSSWIYAYAPSNMVIGTVAYLGGIKQAMVFMDLNTNGVYDVGEPHSYTDSQGRFALPVATNAVGSMALAGLAPAGLMPAGINLMTALTVTGGYNSALGAANTLKMKIEVLQDQLGAGSLPSIAVTPYSSLVSSVAAASGSLSQSLTNSITNAPLQAASYLNQRIGIAMTKINRALGYAPPIILGTGNYLIPEANPLPDLHRAIDADLTNALSIPDTTLINAKLGSLSVLTKSALGVNRTSNTNSQVAASRLMSLGTARLQPAGATNAPPTSDQVDDAFSAVLVARIAAGAEVNLNDPAQLTSLLGDTLVQLPPTGVTTEQIQGAATIIARVNQLTDEAATSGESPADMVTKFMQAQVATQGPVAQQLAAVGAGTLSIEDALANTTPDTLRELAAQATVGDLFGDETRVGIFEFSADSYSVNEDGSTTLPVTVNRSQGDNGAVSVVVSLTPGTAVLGADYTTNTVTLDFAAGELRKTLNLPLLIVHDNALEEPETVNLALALAPGAPAGALLGGRTNATLTINDNDWAGMFEFSQSSYTASEDGLIFDPVMIRRIGGTVGTVNLIVTTLARTNGAVPGVDYINANITVTFGPGERSKRVRVPVINNFTVGDGTRALDLGLSLGGLSAPDAILGGSDRVELLISDDDTHQSVWRQQNFGSPLDRGNGADTAAPDGDGIPNLVKYALNLPSGVPAGDRLPKAYFAAGQPEQKLSLDIPFHPTRTDAVIEVLAADTVAGPWTVIVSISDGVVLTDTGVASVTDGAGGSKVVAVRDLVGSLATRHRFLSVRVRR